MIQYFSLPKSFPETSAYPIVEGRDSVIFFLKRFLWIILFIYSTFFLAVALPFVRTPFYPVYTLGALATTILLFRVVNHAFLFFRYRKGSIRFYGEGVEVTDADKSVRIPASSITYFEHNPFGNLLIREKNGVTSFPLMLLREKDRKQLLGYLPDMKPGRTALLYKVWEMIDAVVVALVLAVHIIQYLVQAYYIPTGSMRDTLLVGDHLFVEKLSYGPVIPEMAFMDGPVRLKFLAFDEIERGDIVIFRPPHEQEKDYIKRCIALPGDRFEIKEGAVYLDGKRLEEPYTRTETTYDQFLVGEREKIEGVVPEGKIIVLGDNRNNSQDSRYFGYLDKNRVKGRAFILYWNTSQILRLDFSRFGLIH